jgi:hypothetical protein
MQPAVELRVVSAREQTTAPFGGTITSTAPHRIPSGRQQIMSENTNENTTDTADVEGHRMRQAPVDDRTRPGLAEDDDVEGHRVRQAPVDERTRPGLIEDDDVEGHAFRQAPADDVTDEGTEFDRPR